MSVMVQRSPASMEFARPNPLFKVVLPAVQGPTGGYPYDVALDGERILALASAGDSEPQTIVVISNLEAELQNRSSGLPK